MFYSETLLSKTGPLAQVWLSANIERKLSKNHILQASVKDSVKAIVMPDQAPMALRLSGQLLLGVVRIHSRQARYLLDDSNEVLMKIKMAFRLSGNNDMPAGIHMPSRDALMLPDVLTEGDNLEMPPMPDATFLLSQMDDDAHASRRRRAGSRDINLQEDFTGSQFLQSSVEHQEELIMEPMDDLDLGLGFDDLDIFDTTAKPKEDVSIEFGRDAPEARPDEEDLFSESGIQVPAKDNIESIEHDTTTGFDFGGGGGGGEDDFGRIADEDGDIPMYGGDQPDVIDLPAAPTISRERISESPLSDIDEAFAAEVEADHERYLHSALYEPEEETEQSIFRNPAQRARKKKVLQPDQDTIISNTQIKAQQQNRDKILKPQLFLPRNPEILALLEMQKNGGFISNIMGDGRSLGWAPELRGMLSLDAFRKGGELKRKRDSGIADMEGVEEQNRQKSPRLNLDLGDDEETLGAGLGDAGIDRAETTVAFDNTVVEIPADDGFVMNMGDDENEQGMTTMSPAANFDETVAPLVHPADSGPISLGTQHAVHLLRERFGPECENSPSKRAKASVLFQDLLPEARTSRADATKMFFEVLVLATKDAVKVEQAEDLLGGPIRVRGKRGLWGAWAEREAGGEIAEEEAGPSSSLERSNVVAVAA